jgi:hypothetical protein
MADTKISALTDGTTAEASDRIAVARDPTGTPLSRYVTPAYIRTYMLSLATTWTAEQTISGAGLTISGNISAAAWTTNGIRLKSVSGTLTDTSSSGTVAAAYTNVLGGNTIAASSSTTFTDYYTMFLTQPTAGTNVTFTRRWALGLSGNLSIAGILNGAVGTITASAPNVFSQTWNSGAVQFIALHVDVTNTASGSSSRLIRTSVGGGEVFYVDRSGAAGFEGGLSTITSAGLTLTNARSVVFGGSLAGRINWSDVGLSRSAAGILNIDNASTGAGALEFREQTAPSAAAANAVRLYAQDNGAGKTQLMAIFNTGAAQQIAIEP